MRLGMRIFIILFFVFMLGRMLAIPWNLGTPIGFNEDWMGFWIVLVVGIGVIPVVFGQSRKPVNQRKAFRDAPIGIATVVGAEHTGLSINDQPQLRVTLDVETADGQTFQAQTKKIFNVGQIHEAAPGTYFGVRYTPDHQVVIDESITHDELTQILQEIQLRQGKISAEQIRVSQEGVNAQAVVMHYRPTGTIRDGESEIELHLKVTRPDGSQFDATRTLFLPGVALAGVQTGSVVDVSYMPYDESFVGVAVRVR